MISPLPNDGLTTRPGWSVQTRATVSAKPVAGTEKSVVA